MSKRSKHRRAQEWWEDEEDYFSGRQGSIFANYETEGAAWRGGSQPSYGGLWGGKNYHKPYDLSVSLGNRIKGLVQTITGEDIELIQANAWGMDEKYLYYHDEDLASASDDRVLGQIMHVLALRLHLELEPFSALLQSDRGYELLLNSLESNRADALLQRSYFGMGYYRQAFWNEAGKQATENLKKVFSSKSTPAGVEWVIGMEALLHGESPEKAFSKPSRYKKFLQAQSLMQQYVAARNWETAEPIYQEIKKFYPPLNLKQQQALRHAQANTGLQTLLGLSEYDKNRALDRAAAGRDEHGSAARGEKGGLSDLDFQNPMPGTQAEYALIRNENQGTIQRLYALLNSVLQNNEARRYVRPYKRGKIDMRSIHKLYSGNPRVFKQRRQIDSKHYGLAILVDQSGSMRDDSKNIHARTAAIVLAEVFNKLGLPFQVSGFNDSPHIYKGFNSRIPREKLLGLSFAGGGTDDVRALSAVREDLRPLFQVQRTGVFVITDGHGADQGAMRRSVEDIQALNGHVLGVGVGLRHGSLNESYPANIIVDKIEELPTALAGLVAQQFKRN